MPNFKGLIKDTAIYGVSSIVGRFLNYLLTPLWTNYMPKVGGDYGVLTNMYSWTALLLVILTFGMETTLFRFANQQGQKPDTVFSTAFAWVSILCALFVGGVMLFFDPICEFLHYADHPEYVWIMTAVTAFDVLQALPFCYLRFQHKAIKFVTLRMLAIVINVACNLVFFTLLHHTEVVYVFAINLACSLFTTLIFVPDFFRLQWHFDGALLRRMLSYSWPILVLGIAGILNQTADKIFFPLVYVAEDAKAQLGEYGACVKVAMIMALITQTFRYGYEPIVFAKNSSSDNTSDKLVYYAEAMKWFIIFTLAAFLAVVAFMDWLKILIGEEYRNGLFVVPIVMAAEIMMGIYFNLSFWYKLIDKTI
ncbi:MAG: oligosaccharide flippase family protein, partial [Bacteroidales bacterium]|nr:oligosaccharide flippase family protein [Bacteroidales bacterium]